ncbi:MAG TPA: 50S ribosomal protein L2 [Candidatus Aenigmarchaeota archaeon]|nr:MAG: 50S ribosomal protein L2 [Candidatus Aenigmarchaeota archaeon]HDD46078.1 50S ribosomal protein L2 [Candidatus Aenigmarchaeota archaeon]
MGKRIIAQRRGRGSPTYTIPKKRLDIRIAYRDVGGRVVDIINDPLRNPPVIKVAYDDNQTGYLIAPHGISVNDRVDFVKPLSSIPIGSKIFGIETYPNSGPKMCRSAGSFAIVLSKTKDKCVIQLPSRKKKELNINCRASIGMPAGDGFKEKPLIKAGKKWHIMHARGKLYPRTSGSAMNAVDHPFGGSTKPGKAKTVSRHAPPGRKVGSISSKRTGKKK